VFRTAAKLCRQYLKWFGNSSYKIEKNGERWLLERLRAEGAGFETILDVGANVGKWATIAARAFPDAAIYALEIVPATFGRLRAETAPLPRVQAINLGLADRSGTLPIRYHPSASAHATFTDYPHSWTGETIDCPVTTGDEFLTTRRLATVDFLKLDIEGAEHLALRGLSHSLTERRIRFVQFEYGWVNILTRFLLKDFYELFERAGYVVGKIYPDYVDFRSYELSDEDFLGPNYLACRADEPLLSRLRGA
jgi:FkbM family methyltransferase